MLTPSKPKLDVIVLAGGLGTRLRSVIQNLPKPMAPVGEQPFLAHILTKLPQEIIQNIVLAVGYKWDVIQDYFGEEWNGLHIAYAVEETPLGTGGGIALALQKCTSDHVLVLNGDTWFDIDFAEFYDFHTSSNFEISLALKKMPSPDRYGTVALENNFIQDFHEKRENLNEGLINGGVYLMKRTISKRFPQLEKFSFEQDFLVPSASQNIIGGYISEGFFIDIGIPEDYERAQSIF